MQFQAAVGSTAYADDVSPFQEVIPAFTLAYSEVYLNDNLLNLVQP